MAIKWFCDLCEKEIVAPEHPSHVKAYEGVRNRDEEGWGSDTDVVSVFAHKKCADILVTELREALDAAKTVASGGQARIRLPRKMLTPNQS